MELRNLFRDDEAVSPVIGVILMVAITVILAAVIGTFVLGLGDQVQSTSPQASFNFEFNANGGSAESVVVTHDGGDSIPNARLEVSAGGNPIYNPGDADNSSFVQTSTFSSSVTAGQSAELTDANDGGTGTSELDDGEDVRIVWTSSSGENSATLGKAESSVGA
jgi:flagellin-like protein